MENNRLRGQFLSRRLLIPTPCYALARVDDTTGWNRGQLWLRILMRLGWTFPRASVSPDASLVGALPQRSREVDLLSVSGGS